MKRILVPVVLLVSAVGCTLRQETPAPRAVILEAQGQVEVSPGLGEKSLPAKVGDFLPPGHRVTTATGASVLLSVPKVALLKIGQQTELALTELSLEDKWKPVLQIGLVRGRVCVACDLSEDRRSVTYVYDPGDANIRCSLSVLDLREGWLRVAVLLGRDAGIDFHEANIRKAVAQGETLSFAPGRLEQAVTEPISKEISDFALALRETRPFQELFSFASLNALERPVVPPRR